MHRHGFTVQDLGLVFVALYGFQRSAIENPLGLRINDSCDLLMQPDLNIGSIAVDLGFYDQSSFTLQFKKAMGLTPLQYRRQFL